MACGWGRLLYDLCLVNGAKTTLRQTQAQQSRKSTSTRILQHKQIKWTTHSPVRKIKMTHFIGSEKRNDLFLLWFSVFHSQQKVSESLSGFRTELKWRICSGYLLIEVIGVLGSYGPSSVDEIWSRDTAELVMRKQSRHGLEVLMKLSTSLVDSSSSSFTDQC